MPNTAVYKLIVGTEMQGTFVFDGSSVTFFDTFLYPLVSVDSDGHIFIYSANGKIYEADNVHELGSDDLKSMRLFVLQGGI